MCSDRMSVSVENIGGIEETEQTFDPGVTILAGRNATNRTSFLQAMMAAYGSTQASLKADADKGYVEVSLDDKTYSRTLKRTESGVSYNGDPYLEDPEVADLFAFLIETNEARLAVPRGDELRDIIMRPVDTAAIHSKIEELASEKRDIDTQIEEIESREKRIPELEERLTERRQDIEEKEEELSEKEADLDDLDRGLEETKREKSELEETFSELREARQELEDLQYKLETEEESLESLRAERTELEATWEDLETVSEARLEELDAELGRLREEKQALESEVSTLQRVIQFNEEMLEEASTDIANTLRAEGTTGTGQVTNQLVETEVVCWTCGSSVNESSIEETLDRLRSLLSEKHEAIRNLENEIDEVRSEKESIESHQRRADELSRRRQQVEDEISQRESTIEALEEDIEAQAVTIEELEAEAESMENENYSEILEKHKDANQLEFELDRLRKEVSDIENELETLEVEVENLEALQTKRESVANELQELRTKVGRMEQESVEAFNEHMAEILDILGYENIERIWLERTERQVRKGRRKVTESTFELHIVRSTPDGTTLEDTVNHLSESEREVTGLIFALAGYLVHDVHEVLPVMLLDSLEAIDSDRIAALIEYFEQYVEYLLVALLPEDAGALSESYNTITEI
jgi:DNA repair exonuclease SbcCD ATPase subunit